MNKKNQISSILNNCNNLVDIFNYHKKKTSEKKFFLKKKVKIGIQSLLLSHQNRKNYRFFY